MQKINQSERFTHLSLFSGFGGQLNPTWVEWLIGFPIGWSDLKDSETP